MRSLFLFASAALVPASLAVAQAPARAIRRDIPLTNMIRRAFAAGTRDSSGRPGRNYWQIRTDYRIDARFEPSTSVVTGTERIVLRNTSPDTLTSIRLRLDQNIFAANVPRAEPVTEITDGMKVTRLAVDGVAADLAPSPARGRVEPGFLPPVPRAYELGQTSARLQLAKAIPPGGTATLEADWNFRVPRADNERGLRMGRWGDSLSQVAQWYPRVAVYDDLRGWDSEPYLGTSEFYNNFGSFDVRLDVPAGWIVGATGVLQNPEDVLTPAARDRIAHLGGDSARAIVGESERGAGRSTAGTDGSRLTWHFTADSVADFAWAISDRFVWDAILATVPGRGAVPIHVLHLPSHAAQYSAAPMLAKHALEFYSRLWMPYAFPVLTVVDGPEGGMEYPMFIMSGAGAADHETGHQWWPMMVGVNETWYGFMDEGFNQYMNILSRADREHVVPQLDGLGQAYGTVSGDEREAPLMWDANYGGPNYGFQAYGKAPLMLSMLGGIVGDSAVWRAMSEYARTWRFKHPSPWDYAFFMSNALHRDLGWFWNSWLFTTESVNGSIQQVALSGTRATVTVRQDGEMPSPVVLEVTLAPGQAPPRAAAARGATVSMRDSATAIVTYPVDVWFNGSRTFTATLDFGRRVTRVHLDPYCRFPDRDTGDNVWPRAAARAAAAVSAPTAARRGRGARDCEE